MSASNVVDRRLTRPDATTTAKVLGSYRNELIDAGIDDENLLHTLLVEAQRHLLSQGRLEVK